MAGENPYRGADSFGFEDRGLFFGRDLEGRALSSKLAVQPVTVLTGRSGTGKSSLLSAKVLPTLATRGWLPVLAQPGDDPAGEIAAALVALALPDPAAEVAALDELVAQLARAEARGGGGADPEAYWALGLTAARELYTSLAPGRAERRRLETVGLDRAARVARHTLVARFLGGAVAPGPARAQLARLAGVPREEAAAADNASLGRLRELLAVPGGGAAARLRDRFAGRRPLARLVRGLWRHWLAPQGWLGLVIVLDQAEELYARPEERVPGAPGAAAAGIGAARRDALHREADGLAELAQTHPVRLCFSLRPEWRAALLAALGGEAGGEPAPLHILHPLGREQAEDALRRPAEALGGDWTDHAVTAVLDGLGAPAEGDDEARGGVDPFLLSVTGELLWDFAAERRRRNGRAGEAGGTGRVEASPPGAAPPASPELEVDRLLAGPPDAAGSAPTSPQPGGGAPSPGDALVEGALAWLVQLRLGGIEESRRFDAFDLVAQLSTREGARRIAPEKELVNRPLRNAAAAGEALRALEEARFVRRSGPPGRERIDIRHERLLRAVDRRARAEAAAELALPAGQRRLRGRLGDAVAVLRAARGEALEAAIAAGLREDPLPGWARDALVANRAAVAWDGPAARAVFASLLHRGPAAPRHRDERLPEAHIADWARARALDGYRLAVRELIGLVGVPLPPDAPADETAERLLRGQWPDPESGERLRGQALPAEAARAAWLLALVRGADAKEIREWTRWKLQPRG